MYKTKDWEKGFDDILYEYETEILGEPFFTPTSVRKIVDILLTQQKKEIVEMIENQISIHSQLEKEWTGIDLIKKIHDKINPHTERKEELEILLNLLTKE